MRHQRVTAQVASVTSTAAGFALIATAMGVTLPAIAMT